MRTFKRMALMTAAILASWSSGAQYTFSAELTISGNCFGMGSSMAERNLRQWVNELNAMLKSVRLTKEECLAMNQQMSGEAATMSYSEYDCTIKLTITPCICTEGLTEAMPGPDHGGSYNSANVGSEVQDWYNDVGSRQEAFDWRTKLQSSFPSGTGDRRFDNALRNGIDGFKLPSNEVSMPEGFELLADWENVRRYLERCDNLAERYIKYPDPDHLVDWFHEEFKRVSGYDVDELMQKLPSELTDDEKQALLDYQAFRRGLADKMVDYIKRYAAVQEETRAYEMSVLSEDCYGDSEHKYLGNTNYKTVGFADFAQGTPLRSWLELIDKCNQNEGFHAQAYINTVTGEITVAFEGSNFHPIANTADFLADWPNCNFLQGTGDIPEQFVLARMIAEAIPEGVSVNFTGHSLGGGLASVAGAISGVPTYTYNPEGVNNNIIDDFGMRETVDAGANNVHVYQANNDPLTSAQEGDLKPIATLVTIGFVSVYDAADKVFKAQDPITAGEAVITAPMDVASNMGNMTIEAVKGNVLSPAIGDKQVAPNDGGHDRIAMVEFLDGGRGHYVAWQQSVHNAGYGHEQQTQSSILIRME